MTSKMFNTTVLRQLLGRKPVTTSLPRSRFRNNTKLPDRAARGFASLSAGQTLTRLAKENPHVDVVRYEHKNIKWTLRHVDFFSNALAYGLLENGLEKGDAMLSWLPLHFAEHHILQFACSKAGFVLYHLDPLEAAKDPIKSKGALKKALEITEATCLFSQEAGDDVNYINLCKEVVPEIRIFDFADGMPFVSPRFPHLRFPIHTGFDIVNKWGMQSFKHMLVPAEDLDFLLEGVDLNGETPLLGEIVLGDDGLPVGKGGILSNDDVTRGGKWPEFSSIVKKDYIEVEGVGVIF